jgi:hypothetical protein
LHPLADSIILLTLTRLVVVIIFENFSFALFTPPLGDYHHVSSKDPNSEGGRTGVGSIVPCVVVVCISGMGCHARGFIRTLRFH